MIQFDSIICRDLKEATSREWLETNGIGGFSSSTIIGLNTRRYHGLLTASTQPPAGRFLLLSKMEETLTIDGRRYELSANEYSGVIHPQGFNYLKSFRLDPFPVFTYQVENLEFEKTVFMIYGENSVIVQYRIISEGENPDAAYPNKSLVLEVRPLIAFRDYHATTRENGALDPRLDIKERMVSLTPYPGLPTLYMAQEARVDPYGYWYRDFEYERELERGLDQSEDLYNPFALYFDLKGKKSVDIIASTRPHDVANTSLYRRAEIKRREELVAPVAQREDFLKELTLAADQFIVRRADQKTILAGYHWFTDWGRDAMIALPGLTLVTERPEVARSIFLTFTRHLDRGIIPNCFSEGDEKPDYHTADATLWLFEAVRAFIQYTKDYDFIRRRLYHILTDIMTWHMHGTHFGIRMDEDGLMIAGKEPLALTWMDARVDGRAVTPRPGKPVEIQALWYNALRVMEDIAEIFGDTAGHEQYRRMAEKTQYAFSRLFWNERLGCLYDVVNGKFKDDAIRPNQILAVSLNYSMLPKHREKSIVNVVERELLTPYGLRSLNPSHPEYCRRCKGDTWTRDRAYHQGTVWTWLMGPFISAYLKVHDRRPEALQKAKLMLQGLQSQLSVGGLRQISEIYDGESPHSPRGCIAQAFSIATILKVASEEVFPGSPVKIRDERITFK